MEPKSTIITLYDAEFDLPEKTLSPFAIRLRLLLDYKRIPYQNVWIHFPDIEASAKSVGAPPTRINADGRPGYTIPFVTIASRDKPIIALSDSAKIAKYVEEAYPDPEGKMLPAEMRVLYSIFSQYLAQNIAGPMFKFVLPGLLRALAPHSRDWLIQTRKSTLGVTIDEMIPKDEKALTEAWRAFDAAFDELAAYLDKAGEGNFRITGEVSYVEFELVSTLNLLKRTNPDEGWKRLEARNGGRWAKLMDLPIYKRLLPANRLNAML
ncbi:uncharacterized protein FOMMEDRAFT_144709 [Fomitiporia mediterranea MF3/22]|uniref:uncharacterized protein n=1 Tax=Fomitiporia mediterranea (strain MF3/22) TaxID=694068 RepID=UPI0004407900|nr:uncharacterized protein FOMMEDRAFT_144709 [Fomitiporia mediterranea MF3/22]EJD06827.1 hypothetical protein FOMMEDRAFT_144709 [Fomitiporia mediterranea MF3/22]